MESNDEKLHEWAAAQVRFWWLRLLAQALAGMLPAEDDE